MEKQRKNSNQTTSSAKYARCIYKFALLGIFVLSVSGCNFLTRLSEVGEEPKLSKISDPTEEKGYAPVSMPMPTPVVALPNSNSLWRPGAKGFFKDQRAANVGDLITVQITIEDSASLENTTEQKRGEDSDSLSIGALGGLENTISKALPSSTSLDNLLDVTSSKNSSGQGTIDRKETISLTVAAVVTQILPNGNLVIQGTQEVRVNYEMRQLQITGIIRREDISSNNTIESEKIAELRMAYGGRGTISDLQQPRYGRQLIDIVSPF